MSDLTAFPMDSQVTGMGDDGLPVYDRAFDSTDLREVYKTYFSNGYFAEVGTSMHVKAASGMTATVEAGKVNIQGTLGFMTEDATVTFAAAGNASRVDTVVARLDLSVEKRVIELDVLKGEEGVTTAPSLTRDSTVWELGLADVTVPANTAAIKDENIGDTRLDTTRCGVVNPFAKLDTDSLFTQVTAIINKASEDTTANIERLESEVDATIADAQSKTAAVVEKAETDVNAAITAADAALAADTAKLDKATADAVSAMNDALSSTVLGSVWRLGSSSAADYLAYGDDLNDIASVCTKFCESASIAGGIQNKPADVTGAFAVYTFATEQDPSRLGQMLLAVDANGVSQFFRSGAGTSWTEWDTVGGADQTARDAAAAAQTTADEALAASGWTLLSETDNYRSVHAHWFTHIDASLIADFTQWRLVVENYSADDDPVLLWTRTFSATCDVQAVYANSRLLLTYVDAGNDGYAYKPTGVKTLWAGLGFFKTSEGVSVTSLEFSSSTTRTSGVLFIGFEVDLVSLSPDPELSSYGFADYVTPVTTTLKAQLYGRK